MIAPRGTLKSKKARKKATRKKPNVIEHPLSSAEEFTNRETGWLHFNRRVLFQAEDPRTPLLERLRFLSICDSNLNEFFMKRVGGLKRQVEAGISPKSSDGKTPQEQLVVIRAFALQMLADMASIREKLEEELAKQNIFLLKWKDLSEKEKTELRTYYKKNIFPVLTPLSVDPGHPFPFISNLSTSFGVTLKHPDQEDKHFARIKIPRGNDSLSQWIRLPNEMSKDRFIDVTEVIGANLEDLFPSMQVLDRMLFRITRNADFDRDDDEADDLLQMIAEELRQRRFAELVRIEHGPKPDEWMMQFLREELELTDADIYEHSSRFDYGDLGALVSIIDRPHLKYPLHQPSVPLAFNDPDKSIFEVIRGGDQLLHHPYESFSATVERFIREASTDPKVVAIKMTLYRTGDNSPFVRSLIAAAAAGKQVVCLVELKARFDEERNIYWARALENAGVHVVYGIVGLKTHAKLALVVRQEDDSIRCYSHIGTGNYNLQTSRLYTDLGLLTCREEITSEIVELFHYLTGRSLKKDYKHLLVAPINMFSRFREMIQRESEHAKAKRPSGIIVKCNNLEENDIVLALYEASRRGVNVQMIVRGFACVRPRHPNMSDRVSVVSTIGRFLEHSRIFYFRNGAADPVDGEFFIGSADWMYRNLHARVEAVVPILERPLREKLWEILQMSLADKRQTWDMHPDGTYTLRTSEEPGLHSSLIELTQKKNSIVDNSSEETGIKVYGNLSGQTRNRRRQGRVLKGQSGRQPEATNGKGSEANAEGRDPAETSGGKGRPDR